MTLATAIQSYNFSMWSWSDLKITFFQVILNFKIIFPRSLLQDNLVIFITIHKRKCSYNYENILYNFIKPCNSVLYYLKNDNIEILLFRKRIQYINLLSNLYYYYVPIPYLQQILIRWYRSSISSLSGYRYSGNIYKFVMMI